MIHSKLSYIIISILPISMLTLGIFWDSPRRSIEGLYQIITSPSILLTDYIAVGGLSSAFINAGLLGVISIAGLYALKVPLNGPFIAAVYTVIGFALFGKNLYNVIPILLGTTLYSIYHREDIRRVLLITLFGTALGPLVSYLHFGTSISSTNSTIIAIATGIAAGFTLPPIASHMLRFHDGYNIYNVGFTAGIVGAFFIAIFRGFNISPVHQRILCSDYHKTLLIFFSSIFTLFIITPWFLTKSLKPYKQLRKILNSSGRLVSDFTFISSFQTTLINMGIMGFFSLIFIIIMGAKINGPIAGAILTVVGFSAFGKHIVNCFPICLGIYIASLFKIWGTDLDAVVISGLFATTLAPIAGQYGIIAGVVAGFFHLSIVHNVSILHGGVNLYNNGFAGGFVASFLVPLLENLKSRKKDRVKQ